MDDDGDEITAGELAALRRLDVPQARGWSTPTFACHRHMSSCVLSCCCPCVQFGMNQRLAFGVSCVKWALIWMFAALFLFGVVVHAVPESDSAADKLVSDVEQDVITHIRERVRGHHNRMHGLPPPPPPPTPVFPVVLPSQALDRSSAMFFALVGSMAMVGAVGAYRRGVLRAKYGIGGSAVGDFVCHTCCTCCSLAKVRAALPGTGASRLPTLAHAHARCATLAHRSLVRSVIRRLKRPLQAQSKT
jgi:Cys-rich protein (TIGR01571 family)